MTKRPHNDLVDPTEFDSYPKRRRRSRVHTVFFVAVMLALIALLAVRLHKVALCAEAHGFYERTRCDGSTCCETYQIRK